MDIGYIVCNNTVQSTKEADDLQLPTKEADDLDLIFQVLYHVAHI